MEQVVQLIIFAVRPKVLSEKRKHEFFRPLTIPYNYYVKLFQHGSEHLLIELDQKWKRYELLRLIYDGIPFFMITSGLWLSCRGTNTLKILFALGISLAVFILSVFASREQANKYMKFLYASLKEVKHQFTPKEERLFDIVIKVSKIDVTEKEESSDIKAS